MDFIVRLFRRETSSTEFIPVIDGLRFLAISMVVFYHINGYIFEKSSAMSFAPAPNFFANNILSFGHQGVQLFFVISGFILAMPFMRQRLNLTEKKLSVWRYYLRRLTRLEPPYIVSTVLLFLLLVFIIHDKYSIGDLTASLASSLLYISNFVFPGETPHINPVTWSLEIEVQYYLIAPFIIWGLCLLKDKVRRRAIILLLIVVFAVVSWLIEITWRAPVLNLAMYLQYFMSGILLCDVFLLDEDKFSQLNGLPVFCAGAVLLVFLISVEHTQASNLGLKIISPLAMFGFYAIVFGNRWWKKIFSLNALTLIGGMCYTIYLLHYAIISAVGRFTTNRPFFANFYLSFLFQALVFVIAVLLISSVYFLLIEKPCMKRDWHLSLINGARSTLATWSGTKLNEDT